MEINSSWPRFALFSHIIQWMYLKPCFRMGAIYHIMSSTLGFSSNSQIEKVASPYHIIYIYIYIHIYILLNIHIYTYIQGYAVGLDASLLIFPLINS